jgi:hypothetical protein
MQVLSAQATASQLTISDIYNLVQQEGIKQSSSCPYKKTKTVNQHPLHTHPRATKVPIMFTQLLIGKTLATTNRFIINSCSRWICVMTIFGRGEAK